MLNSRTAFAVIVGKLIVWNGQKALYAKRGGKKRSRKFDGRRDMRSWDDLSAMCKICSAKSTSCEYRVVGKNFPCLKIPAPSVARQSGLPMHSPISQFRKVLVQFSELCANYIARPCITGMQRKVGVGLIALFSIVALWMAKSKKRAISASYIFIGHRKGRVVCPWRRALKGPLQKENKREEGRGLERRRKQWAGGTRRDGKEGGRK